MEKLGVLSTFHQHCGLAEYAGRLLKEFNTKDYVVFAEDISPTEITTPDEENVIRCWNKWADNYQELIKAISISEITTLYINCQHSFFKPIFYQELLPLKQQGLKIISQVHNPDSVSPLLQILTKISDQVIVHTEENVLEIIANGGTANKVKVIEMGIDITLPSDTNSIRNELDIPQGQSSVCTFGFLRAHKGIDGCIEAIKKLSDQGTLVHLYVVGSVHSDDKEGEAYLAELKNFANSLDISELVHFVIGFHPEELIKKYLMASDIAIFNYQSNFYEASAAVAMAYGCGVPIITSSAPTFQRLGDSVFHTTDTFDLAEAIASILDSPILQQTLRENAKNWANTYSWEKTAPKFKEVFKSSP